MFLGIAGRSAILIHKDEKSSCFIVAGFHLLVHKTQSDSLHSQKN
jgi:hypothetical protein